MLLNSRLLAKAPPACEQVKECMAEAAKKVGAPNMIQASIPLFSEPKAFMGSAIMGAAATGVLVPVGVSS